ncbi:nitroreductase family protein [Methanoplanus endosymbiosus]|uniref:Nitroreductase family protein n=1 Tax=Methanoplanus endosymbiosus TaxID=33865 RepID=A0A9E7PSY8_9EURY|nr:nitroreductase family protein [Methanoplanus endosymbiosus]UUX93247.1 nitroreductase family protein [Methanoplanus endosymbiosus]
MSIIVDPERCNNCGICGHVCPVNCIIVDKKTLPYIPEELTETCTSCGQCEAFCPKAAIICDSGGEYSEFTDLNAPDITVEQLHRFLLNRRPFRNFRSKHVDPETIQRILDTARYAPSAGNEQPIKWIIITGKKAISLVVRRAVIAMEEEIKKDPKSRYIHIIDKVKDAWLNGEDLICRSAPHIVIASVPEESPYYDVDSVIALSWFELATYSHGIGTSWCGLLQVLSNENEHLRKQLRIPIGYKSGCVMIFGYGKFRVRQIPPRNPPDVSWFGELRPE